VSTEGLREARRNWTEHGERAARSRVLLSLEEVRASGLPAFFFDYDEHLLYLDGELFDLRDGDAAWQTGSRPSPLPRCILEDGVGIEHGWRHAGDCRCHVCSTRAPKLVKQQAVA
jgi:hypothetical protein